MEQDHTRDQTRPNRESNMEKAEGSRETVMDNERADGGGITNRSRDRERREQEQLPKRGQTGSER